MTRGYDPVPSNPVGCVTQGSTLLHHAAKQVGVAVARIARAWANIALLCQDNPTCIHKLLDFRLSAVKSDFNVRARALSQSEHTPLHGKKTVDYACGCLPACCAYTRERLR